MYDVYLESGYWSVFFIASHRFSLFFVLLEYTKNSYYNMVCGYLNIIYCDKKNVCLLNIVNTESFTVSKNVHFTDLIIACHKSITVMYFMPMEIITLLITTNSWIPR